MKRELREIMDPGALARTVVLCLLLATASLFSSALTAQTQPQEKQSTDSQNNQGAPASSEADAALLPGNLNERLALHSEQLAQRRAELKEIRKEIATLAKGVESPELKAREQQVQVSIKKLNDAFAQLATNGIDLVAIPDDKSKPYNWQDELVSVIKPVLGTLKELTEKPRRIEEMRNRMDSLKDQIKVADQALKALGRFQPGSLNKAASNNIDDLRKDWTVRRNDLISDLEKTRIQLQKLDTDEYSYNESLIEPTVEFLYGRGLTLVIAIAVALIIWYGLNLLFKPLISYVSTHLDRKARRSRERVISYLYRALTGFVVVLGVLIVFYLRSDTLLLALAILALGFVVIGLRHLAPKYVRELRLLVDLGSVRENERLIYNGLPMQVRSINTFAILRNPSLEGIVRLPLSDLTTLISRPTNDEWWFPCEANDVVLLPDGAVVTIERQTIDTVRVRIGPSVIGHPTTDFAKLALKNLSRDGFTIITTFGIDYHHQPIALDIADQFQQAVQDKMNASTHAEHVENVSAEFKEAATNSLDYIIFVRMNGAAAASYFAIGRQVQRALVDLCNRQGWGIPFAQLTVHVDNEAAGDEQPASTADKSE